MRQAFRIVVTVVTLVICLVIISIVTSQGAEVVRWQASMYHEPQWLACGGRFDPAALTVAHRELPCGTKLILRYGHRSAVVTVNDWGPAPWTRRTIDLSRGTAKQLWFPGTGRVRVAFWPPLPKADPRGRRDDTMIAWGEE